MIVTPIRIAVDKRPRSFITNIIIRCIIQERFLVNRNISAVGVLKYMNIILRNQIVINVCSYMLAVTILSR